MADSRSRYRDVHVIRDPDNVVAVITEKIDDGFYSYSFMKEYERDGEVVRTSFLHRRHGAAVRRLLPQVEEWIDKNIEQQRAKRLSR